MTSIFRDMYPNREIRGVSLRQPYACLILAGKLETRTWATEYRGLVLVCSSKKPYYIENVKEISGFEQVDRIYKTAASTGLVGFFAKTLCIAELIDCRPMRKEDEERAFVKFNPELFIHEYANIQRVVPVPIKGALQYFTLQDSDIDQILIRIEDDASKI